MNGLTGRTAARVSATLAVMSCLLGLLVGPASAQTVPHLVGSVHGSSVESAHVTAAMATTRTVVQVSQSSLYSANKHPQVALTASRTAAEVGTKFTVSTAGSITAIRFYKGGQANGGRHVGSLWSTANVLLRRQVFNRETASGWQTVRLTHPLRV